MIFDMVFNEYGASSDLGAYFLALTLMVEARVELQVPVPVFMSFIVWLEPIIFIKLYYSTH